MASAVYDLIYLREALENLEAYLLSQDLFWNFPVKPPPGEPTYPALTLGGILFAEQRLKGRDLPPDVYAEFRKLSNQLQAIRSHWRTAWDKKAADGFRARLNQWRYFLEEYRQAPSEHADRYQYEVRVRVMLSLLEQDNPYIPENQRELLASLDLVVGRRLKSSKFIWDEVYQPGFPPDKFPYLYGLLPVESNGG
jgi:hypothetical protein